MTLHLPPAIPDPAWQRRREALARASTDEQRAEIRAVPLVADRAFDPGAAADCPRRHVDDHAADWPPVNHDGRPHVKRECLQCHDTWLERVDLIL